MKNFFQILLLNHKHFFLITMLIGVLNISASAQKKIKEKKDEKTGSVELNFIPVVDGKPFLFDSIYTTPLNQKYSINNLKFYLSNLAFAKSIGVEHQAKSQDVQNVFLVDFKEGNQVKFQMAEGEYTDIRFNIGVPRNLNHSDPSTAKFPLDMGRGDMYWNWNTGYIFFLMEGKGPDIPKSKLHFAIGSDSRIMPFSFGDLFSVTPLVKVEKGKTTKVNFIFDLNKIFINGEKKYYDLSTFLQANVHGGSEADQLRLNILNCLNFENSKVE